MNNDRRKTIEEITTWLEALKNELDQIKTDIEMVKGEEQNYFDAMPESLQQGEKGSIAETAISALEEAEGEIDQAFNSTETDISALETAQEE